MRLNDRKLEAIADAAREAKYGKMFEEAEAFREQVLEELKVYASIEEAMYYMPSIKECVREVVGDLRPNTRAGLINQELTKAKEAKK